MNTNKILADIDAEVRRASHEDMFPTWPTDPLHAVAIINEEVGELNKAILQCTYEPHKPRRANVREEAIQAAAMLVRFLMSDDAGAYWYEQADNQHVQQLDDDGGELQHDLLGGPSVPTHRGDS